MMLIFRFVRIGTPKTRSQKRLLRPGVACLPGVIEKLQTDYLQFMVCRRRRPLENAGQGGLTFYERKVFNHSLTYNNRRDPKQTSRLSVDMLWPCSRRK